MEHARNVSLWGLFVIVLGVWWLLGETGLAPFSWRYVGPLAIIVAGVGMVASRWRRG